MKIIDPKVEEIKDFEGSQNFFKTVARAARICYASDKKTGDVELVQRLVKSKHYSPFAHAIIYVDTMKYSETKADKAFDEVMNYCLKHKYTRYRGAGFWAILNGRVIVEACETALLKNPDIALDTMDMLDNFLTKVKSIEITLDDTFKSFIVDTSIGVTREMNRHGDDFYICEQSTRYCNFSMEKFGKEVAFNKPYWYDEASEIKRKKWSISITFAEFYYFFSLNGGLCTDEARGILPLDTHTRAIYTATKEEWNHIIDLRLKGTTGKPHGDIMVIADMINKLING